MKIEEKTRSAEIIHIPSYDVWSRWVEVPAPLMTYIEEDKEELGIQVLFSYFPEGFNMNDPYGYLNEKTEH